VKRLLSLLLVALTLWSLAFPALAMNLEIPKHPSTARMRVRPKLGEGPDLNLYRYVGNSPYNFSDPSGLIVFWTEVNNVHQDNTMFGGVHLQGTSGWITLSPFTYFSLPGIHVKVFKKRCDGSERLIIDDEVDLGRYLLMDIGTNDWQLDIPHTSFSDAETLRFEITSHAYNQRGQYQSDHITRIIRVNHGRN
jgi:hypothetical protein